MRNFRRAISQTALIAVVVIVIIIIVGGAYAALTLGVKPTTSTTPPTTTPTSSNTGTSTAPTTTSSTCPSSSQTINIGVLEPFTGSAAEEGDVILKGAQIAAANINAAGGACVNGQGMQVKIFSADEGTGGSVTIAAFNQLVSTDNVSYVIGPDFTGDFESIFPEMVQTHTIVMTTTASLDSLFNVVSTNYSNYKWMFRLATTDAQNGQAIASVLTNEIHAQNVAFVGEDYVYASEAVNDTIASNSSIHAVTQDYFDPSTPDYSSEITKISSLGAQAVVCVMSGSNALTFAQQFRQNPSMANIPLIDTTGSPLENPTSVAGLKTSDPSLLNGILVESLYYTMNLSNKTASYVASYAAQTGQNSTLFDDGAANDAVHIIVNAVVSAGTRNTTSVVTQLEKTNYVGVTGTIQFDSTHQLIVSPTTRTDAIFEWQNGKPVTIYPSTIADGSYVAP